MAYPVHPLPPALYRKLLILDPPIKEISRVKFSDMNEVKYFKKTEPPSYCSSKPLEETFRRRIKYLEREIERVRKENRQMKIESPVLNSHVAPPSSERSVVSPFRPRDYNWTSRDVHTPHPPANVRQAIQASPVRPQQVATPSRTPQQPATAEDKPSLKKRIILGLGALSAVATVPGFIAGFVALGPIGFVIPLGLGILSAALLGIGSRVK